MNDGRSIFGRPLVGTVHQLEAIQLTSRLIDICLTDRAAGRYDPNRALQALNSFLKWRPLHLWAAGCVVDVWIHETELDYELPPVWRFISWVFSKHTPDSFSWMDAAMFAWRLHPGSSDLFDSIHDMVHHPDLESDDSVALRDRIENHPKDHLAVTVERNRWAVDSVRQADELFDSYYRLMVPEDCTCRDLELRSLAPAIPRPPYPYLVFPAVKIVGPGESVY